MYNPNQHITEFLNYYCDLASPQYAVMLKGKWGSGKTHYINEYKKELETQKKKYIYVSLYGVTSYDEIETKFLEVLHPKLYNKKTILAGKIVKVLLKATIKVDLDDDGKPDGTISGQIPNLDAGDLLNTKDYILIFDDLERCSIDINDLLGYINYFVEHQDYRVILLANDEKFKSKKYKDIKEKLIGKIFEVVSNAELAYDSFIEEIDNKIFCEYKNEIIEIYKQSGYDNLRVLRQAIFDFDRFYKIIELNNFKDELVKNLVKIFFILTIESKFNKYKIFKLKKYQKEYILLTVSKNYDTQKKIKKTKYAKLIDTYNIYLYENTILELELWENILSKSIIEKEKISHSLKNTRYYKYENSPNWEKLWNFRDFNDNEFDQILTIVEDELINNKLKNVWEVRHVCAILLHLNEYDLYSKTPDEIVAYSKSHIDYLYNENKIDKSLFEDIDHVMSDESLNQLGYFNEENQYSKDFLAYLQSILEKGEKQLIIDDAKNLPSLFKSDIKKAKELLLKEKYSNTAILHLIDVSECIDIILTFDYYSFLDLGYIFTGRYKSSFNNNELTIEMDFLLQFKKELEEKQNNIFEKIVKYNLNKFIKFALSKAIKDLQSYKKNKENQTDEIQ